MTEIQDLQFKELAEAAQVRVAFYSFLNLHFVTLVDSAFVMRLRNGELGTVLEALKQDETNEEDMIAGAALMLDYLKKTSEMDLAQLTEKLGVDRTRLYRGVAKGYGPPPPYEMVWSNKAEDYGVLQTISKVYRDAGLEPSPDTKDRLDYISVEMDFMRELAQNEVNAWNSGEPGPAGSESASQLLEREMDFMTNHFGGWVPFFIEEAFKFVETDFYRGHLLMLRGFVSMQKEIFSTISLVAKE
jgi:TorA maturation chaperone TorD